LKQLFHIKNDSGEQVQEVLSIRLGEKHFSFVITNKEGNVIHELAYCALDQCNEQELAECRKAYPVLSHAFYNVLIAYDNSQSLLIPSGHYKPGESSVLLKTMTGDLYGSHIISEQVNGWQLFNIYGMPKDVQDWMSQQFPYGNSRHQYSLAIKDIITTDAGCVVVDFRTEDFTVLVARHHELLLARTIPYSTPEDVLYYLLKICEQFSLSQHGVRLRLSGLIDQQSALYRELTQYFIDIQFRQASWSGGGNEYPAHFFTSLNDLARCAS